MMCREHSVHVRCIIVSLAVLSLTASLIGVVTPGWYNYEGKLVNYEMKMAIASKMFTENSKRTIRQAPSNFDSDSESMPVKAPAEHEDKENQAESSDFASGSRPKNGPAKGVGDEDRPHPPNTAPRLASDMSAAGKETSNGDRPDTPNTASSSMPDNPPDGHESNNSQPHPAFTGSDGSGPPNHKIPKRPGNDATDNLLPPPKGPSPSDTRNGDNVPPRPLRPAIPDTGDSDEASSHLNHAQNQEEDGHTDDMYNRHPGMGTDGTSNRQPGMNNEDTANRVPGMDTDTIAEHNDDDDTDNSDAGNGDKSGTDIMPPLLIPSNNGNPKPRPIWSFNRTRPTKPTRPPILLPSNRTRRPGNRPGFTLPTRIPLPRNKTQWRPGSTKNPKNSGLNDQSTKPNPDDVNDKLDWFAGIKDKLTGSDTKPDWIMDMLKQLKGGNFSDRLMDKIDNVEYSIHLGLWFGKLCEMLDGVRTCDGEKLSLLLRKLKTPGKYSNIYFEPRHEKICFLHMRKQSRRPANQCLCFRFKESTIHLLPKSEISILSL